MSIRDWGKRHQKYHFSLTKGFDVDMAEEVELRVS